MDASIDEALHPKIVITLVHGTYARNALWCKPGSLIRDALQSRFPAAEFQIFNWSGFNTHAARLKAADRLSRLISSSSVEQRRHVLIGHSHGGNIIRYALGHADTAQHVRGVVTLAAPFLEVSPRKFSLLLKWIVRLLAWQAVIFCAASLLALFVYLFVEFNEAMRFPTVDRLIVKWIFLPVFLFLVYLARTLYLIFIARFAVSVMKRLEAVQIERLNALSAPVIEGIPLLAIIPVGDEARLGLKTSSVISNAMSSAALLTTLFTVSMIILTFKIIVVVADLSPGDVQEGFSFLLVCSVLIVVLMGPLILISTLAPTLVFPRLLHAPLFGEKGLVDNYVLDVTTSAEPGVWRPAFSMRVPFKSVLMLRKLRHSAVYEVDKCLSAVCDFIDLCRPLEPAGPIAVAARGFEAQPPIDPSDLIWVSDLERFRGRING